MAQTVGRMPDGWGSLKMRRKQESVGWEQLHTLNGIEQNGQVWVWGAEGVFFQLAEQPSAPRHNAEIALSFLNEFRWPDWRRARAGRLYGTALGVPSAPRL